ncbi:MAG: 16S rRNA (adenine(1518)-N(6)/adenine(1519)-N(6))-dimethyltransferase RsmA [Candidatus Omnitrophica bacterium]|nr:16S rRNA (adenine(1518)-N(6)/adenine(1519)-N(6))-dimethyltransferase RsmA [Candidatus Omnitrophota bacterium]
MTFIAKKSLGQNFLVNSHYRNKILEACCLGPDDIVLEIGPGRGALTFELAKRVKKVIAVEVDDELFAWLSQQQADSNIEFIHQSILDFPLDRLPEGTIVVSNLPYNIATPIIERILACRNRIKKFYMTVQLEYGQRIVASPGSKKYGSFSCFVQYYASTRFLFKIPPAAFRPVPKVYSCFLCLNISPSKGHAQKDEDFLFRLIRTAFQQRRKKLANALCAIMSKDDMEKILLQTEIPLDFRAESVSLEQYMQIAVRAQQGMDSQRD